MLYGIYGFIHNYRVPPWRPPQDLRSNPCYGAKLLVRISKRGPERPPEQPEPLPNTRPGFPACTYPAFAEHQHRRRADANRRGWISHLHYQTVSSEFD